MFIEIENYETGVTQILNAFDVAYVYKKENNDVNKPYVVVYKLVSGLTYLEGFASSSDADDRIDEIEAITIGGGGDLSNYYTKAETDAAIATAIGTALGGSY